MAEYIDKEKLLLSIYKAYCEECTRCDVHCRACWVDDMRLEIADASTADVVEVVRCKDCIHKHPMIGNTYGYCIKHNTHVYDDDFCSYGAKMNLK